MVLNDVDFKNGEIVREITDEEAAFYYEHGWVKLDRLIAPDVAAKLLAAAQEHREIVRHDLLQEPLETADGDSTLYVGKTPGVEATMWVQKSGAESLLMHNLRAEPFLSVAMNKSFGRAAWRISNRWRLTNQITGMYCLGDLLWCKTSVGIGSGNVTAYHQDWSCDDPVSWGRTVFWVALHEVTPESGAMRFLDKSHRAGPLWKSGTRSMLEVYPKLLEQYEWSPPMHYKPGDATSHHVFTVHGGEENSTGQPRWSYVCYYAPEDIRPDACIDLRSRSGFGYPEPHDQFPKVYP